MEFQYSIVDKEEMILLGIKEVISERNKEEIYRFLDVIVQDGRYKQLFSAQKQNIGEWNVYTSNSELARDGKHLFMVATELNHYIDLSKLDGMRLDFMHVAPAQWLKIDVTSHEQMEHVHKRMVLDDCAQSIGFQLDYHYNKPIMEFQPISCM